ncbi:toprim domain-containing protein [Vibrio alginolyticus]|nr:toprim domain-containing protein [Vibrio alginolyticus]
MHDEESVLLARGLPCDDCGSSDARAEYSDGHSYCYACPPETAYKRGNGKPMSSSASNVVTSDFKPLHGEYRALPKRAISEETAKRFGYRVGEAWHPEHKRVEIAHICDVKTEDGKYIAQKCRFADKAFSVNGKISKGTLIGMHLFSGGRRLVISEGEIDMMSISQMQGNKYPVVSLPNGVQSAKTHLLACIDYLKKFEEVVLAFDMDDVGQDSAQKAAEALAGVVNIKIAKYELKDANEMLLAGKTSEMVQALWNAEVYTPDGLLDVDDILETLFEDDNEQGLPWKHKGMNRTSNGRFYGEVHTLGAGTGLGKTTLLLEQADYDVTVLKQKVGLFMVENDPKEVLRSICGKHDGRLYHVRNTEDYTMHEAIRQTAQLYRGDLYIYDNWGLCEWDAIKAKIVYLVSLGFRVFYVDHLTALATGAEKDEKAEIERIMADIASLAQRHQILIHLVSHLSTPEKGSHEEGARVAIKHFKGSRSIGFWSHAMYGLERNQQAESLEERLITTVRQLKRRGFGSGVGGVTRLRYVAEQDKSYEVHGDEPSFKDHEKEQF